MEQLGDRVAQVLAADVERRRARRRRARHARPPGTIGAIRRQMCGRQRAARRLGLSIAARTAPHSSWPSTTISGTPSTATAYSRLPTTESEMTWPALRTTNRSPRPLSKMISAASRESEQPNSAASGAGLASSRGARRPGGGGGARPRRSARCRAASRARRPGGVGGVLGHEAPSASSSAPTPRRSSSTRRRRRCRPSTMSSRRLRRQGVGEVARILHVAPVVDRATPIVDRDAAGGLGVRGQLRHPALVGVDALREADVLLAGRRGRSSRSEPSRLAGASSARFAASPRAARGRRAGRRSRAARRRRRRRRRWDRGRSRSAARRRG